MRPIVAAILVAACLLVTTRAVSQTISFTGADEPLERVFAYAKKKTGYGFFYKADALENTHKVTLDVKNVSLTTFLDICLRDQPLNYKITGQTVFITRKEQNPPAHDNADHEPIAAINGQVTNTQGEPLANANVVVKRTGRGTVTNANGEFTLNYLNPDDILLVSFIGYKSQSAPIRDRSDFTLIMEQAANDLDKVVVQAYGTITQRLATGNIGTVRSEDIAKQPVMNPLEAVQGQVPGVIVTNTTGYASGTIKVEIRGRNIISPDFPSDPLYIIDGVPLTILDLTGFDTYKEGSQGVIQSGLKSPAGKSGGGGGQSPFFSLNPADIESIEVLKDADATSIYGSRGSNGVILITTKKGKAGRSHFDLSANQGIANVPVYYRMLNTPQYVSMRREALQNDKLPIDINNAPDLVAWDTTRYTDWQKYMWGHLGSTTDVQATLSGGDARTTFRIGSGYHYQREIMTSSGANHRESVSFSIDHSSPDQKFKFGLAGTYTYTSNNLIYLPGTIITPPNASPIFDSRGRLNYAGWSPLNGSFPFGPLLQPYSANSDFFNGRMSLGYEIINGLTIKSTIGYNNITTRQTYFLPIASQDPSANPTGTSSFGYTFIRNLIVEPQLEYNRFIGKGKINFVLGASLQQNVTSANLALGYGYTNDDLLSSVGNAPTQVANNSRGEYKYEAAFGRINYNWKNRYIINFNARRDGSTRFGPGKQFGNFGSVGAAWIFTEEDWAKKTLPFLSFGKLRASYGISGGDQISDYQYLTQWQFAQFTYNNVLPLIPLGHADSLLHWEVNKKLEIAANIGLLHDRISVEAAWYRNRCNDQLVRFPTPYFTGFGGVTSNSPAEVENRGFEFVINGRIIDAPHFKWSAKFNIGFNHNILLAYPNLWQSPYRDVFQIGQSLNIRKVLHYTGIDPNTGTYAFEDRNKDGQITIDVTDNTSDDRYTLDLSPKFDGGLINNITYRNWQVSFFFYFRKRRGTNALANLTAPGDINNQPIEVLGRWQKPGDRTDIARFRSNGNNDNLFIFYQQSDAVLTDASYIRLQNVSVSYTIPDKIVKKKGISNCKFFLQGQNLFVITKYKGPDPEIEDYSTLPLPRILTAGFSINF